MNNSDPPPPTMSNDKFKMGVPRCNGHDDVKLPGASELKEVSDFHHLLTNQSKLGAIRDGQMGQLPAKLQKPTTVNADEAIKKTAWCLVALKDRILAQLDFTYLAKATKDNLSYYGYWRTTTETPDILHRYRWQREHARPD